MKITIERREQTVLLTLSGDLDLFARDEFVTRAEALAAEGLRTFELDMSRVGHLSSTGTASLLRVRNRLRELGGSLRVVQASAGVVSSLASLGLDNLLLS